MCLMFPTQSYIESKLAAEANNDDVKSFMDKVWKDPSSHRVFADVVRRVSCIFLEIVAYL